MLPIQEQQVVMRIMKPTPTALIYATLFTYFTIQGTLHD